MFNREDWKTENIVRGIAGIRLSQAHTLIWMTMFGAVLFLIGVGWISRSNIDDNRIPQPLLLMAIGYADFSLFFPMAYIIYLAKELQKAKERINELERKEA